MMMMGMQQHSHSFLALLLMVFISGIVLSGPSTPRRSRVRRQNMKVRINATGDTIVMKFLRPNADTKLEGYILGYGSSMFSKQFIRLPENGQPYETEFDAEPKYLIAVQPIPTNEVKKRCTGKVELEKPLHLVIGSVTPTSVLLSWGTLLKTPYESNVMSDCLEDGHYTVRYRERSRKWNYQTCPTSDTVIDNLRPNTVYEFGVQPNTKDGSGQWSKPVIHSSGDSEETFNTRSTLLPLYLSPCLHLIQPNPNPFSKLIHNLSQHSSPHAIPNHNPNQHPRPYSRPNQNPNPNQHPRPYSRPNQNPNPNQHPRQYSRPNPSKHPGPDLRPNHNPDPNQHPSPDSRLNQKHKPNQHPSPDSRLNQNHKPNQNPKPYCRPNQNPNPNQHPRQYSRPNPNKHPDPDSRPNHNPDPNQHPSPDSRLNQKHKPNQHPSPDSRLNQKHKPNQHPSPDSRSNQNHNPNQHPSPYSRPNPSPNLNQHPSQYTGPNHNPNQHLNPYYICNLNPH
ncbi:Target of Nesh-SH3 [Larimichthys crocea]|uniref:Target of Nesh-SH3 n=1 Tax=Larimichthys crocea TaxID=215358 RepID=A0A6G0J6E4_LARCR|nr:Target of Nesh-SH3 [Larimichthys crocea]